MSTQLTTEETIARVFNLPRFAPLSLSFLSHIIDLPISPDSLRNSKPVHDGLDALLPRLVIARREVAQRLRAVSASQSVSMEWFRQELALITQRKQAHNLPDVVRQRKRYPITDPTIASWRQKNILLPSPARGQSNTDNDAAILIAALVDPRMQGYLPSFIDRQEPRYWCYAHFPPTLLKDGTQLEPSPRCLPYPLPAGLPAATLLWMPWSTFEPGWLPIDTIGAIRFAGVKMGKHTWRWAVKKRELALWEPDLQDPDSALLTGNSLLGNSLPRDMIESILRRLATSRLLSDNLSP